MPAPTWATTIIHDVGIHEELNTGTAEIYAASIAQVDELIALADHIKHRTGKQLEPYCEAGYLQCPEIPRMEFWLSPRRSPHSGQLEQLFMSRSICQTWQWSTRTLASSNHAALH